MNVALFLLAIWVIFGFIASILLLRGNFSDENGRARFLTDRGERTIIVVCGPLVWLVVAVSAVIDKIIAPAWKSLKASLKNWFFGKTS